jgi:hypothetical protein
VDTIQSRSSIVFFLLHSVPPHPTEETDWATILLVENQLPVPRYIVIFLPLSVLPHPTEETNWTSFLLVMLSPVPDIATGASLSLITLSQQQYAVRSEHAPLPVTAPGPPRCLKHDSICLSLNRLSLPSVMLVELSSFTFSRVPVC